MVDDDELSLIITSKLLQETRMTIDTANSVEECLKKTQKYPYQLIIMDYMIDLPPEVNKKNNKEFFNEKPIGEEENDG